MYRPFAIVLAVLATSAAWAQTTYDPRVAYTQPASGKSVYLYLANADGTRAVRVATATNINSVDFAPGGGRIAFSDSQGIKLLSYTASNSGIVVTSTQLLVSGAFLQAPDFSSDGSRIIYTDAGQIVRAVAASVGSTPVTLYSGGCVTARWLRTVDLGNAFACMKWITGQNTQEVDEIWTVLLDSNDVVTSAGPVLSTAGQDFKLIQEFDVARTRNALLMVVSYPTTTRIVEFNLTTPGAVLDKGAGVRVHYSANDSRIIFISPHQAAGDYVSSLDIGTGVTTRLTKKGTFGTTDARP